MATNVVGQRGFTLLEVLIALTLLAVLAGLIYGGLRFGNRVWERGSDAAAVLGEVGSARALCRRQIRAALPLPLTENGEESGRYFEGTATTMRFLAPAPAEALTPGVYEVSFAAVAAPESGGAQLRMGWRLVAADRQDGVRPFRAEVAGEAVLMTGAAAIRFRYLDASLDDGDGWQEQWMSEGALPALVGIEVLFLTGDRRVWPELLTVPAAAENAR